jgi:hypothetical protein
MTLPLPAGFVDDAGAQANFETIQIHWPIVPRSVYGIVGSGGGIQQAGSNNWTSVRNAVGDYTVIFNSAFPAVNSYVPVLTCVTGVAIFDIVTLNAGNFRYWIINVAGAFSDSAAAFHVLAPGT